MTRSPAPADTGADAEVVYLLEVVFWTGSAEDVARLTTASQDITVDADGDGLDETYTAAEGVLNFQPPKESPDARGQSARLELSAVDTTILSKLLQRDFRGRRVRIWRASLDPSAGTISDTYLLHRGLQLGDYQLTERMGDDMDQPGMSRLETESASRIQALQQVNAVRTNPVSHNAFLAREGQSTGDKGMDYVDQLPGRVFWGQEAPDPASDGSGSGGSAGTSGGGGGHIEPGDSGPGFPRVR